MALDTTIGGAASNSFCSVAEANAYHVLRGHNAEWGDSGVSEKEAALAWATRILDRLNWSGNRAATTQALRWPRYNAYDQDGYVIANTVIPTAVKNATAELALYLRKEDRTADSGAIGVKSLSVGALSLEFDTGAYTKAIPDSVRDLIAFLLEDVGSSVFKNVVRA